jgi:hypothetical protein
MRASFRDGLASVPHITLAAPVCPEGVAGSNQEKRSNLAPQLNEVRVFWWVNLCMKRTFLTPECNN